MISWGGRLFYAFLITLLGVASVAHAFTDVPISHKYYEAVKYINEKGIIQGYENNVFKPDHFINRAEFLKIITLSSGLYDADKTASCFYDVPANIWFTPYVCSAKDSDLVKGYPDGSFKPSEYINFVEALKIVEKAYGMQYVEEEDPWYRGMIQAAETKNLIPLSIDSFGKLVTRSEVSELISRFMHLNSGTLESFLKEKNNFRVTYQSIENKILIEKEWLAYLDTLNSNIYSPQTFEKNISLPEPRNNVFRGDGFYEVTAGDQIYLNNGVIVEIASLNKAGDEYVIYANYYLNKERVNFFPVSLSQVTEKMGAKIEINLYRKEDADPRYFNVTFTGIGQPATTADFYNDCKNTGGTEIECLKYIIFDPLPNESIKTDGVYRIIYPKGEDAAGQYYFDQVKQCLPEVIKATNLAPTMGIIPIRLRYSDSQAVITNKSGIFIPILTDGKEKYIQTTDCIDSIMVHELTHFLILPAYIPDVLNESYAYYIEKDVTNELFDSKTGILEKGKTLNVNQSFTDDESGITVTFLGVDNVLRHVPVVSIEDKKGRFKVQTVGVPLNTAIGLEKFINAPLNLVIYASKVDKNTPSATFDFYLSPPIREFLICNDDGYEHIVGWKNSDGEILTAFNSDKYNDYEAIPMRNSNKYVPLNAYLSDGYPWQSTYLDFYSTGACMWRKYLKTGEKDMKDVFSIINDYKNKVVTSKDDFTVTLYQELGAGFKSIAQGFGL